MTEPYKPRYRPPEPTQDLGDALAEIGHTPESFARAIDRNPSGLRRLIRGEHRASTSMVKDIIKGLRREGFRGDTLDIKQLHQAGPRSAMGRTEGEEGTNREPAKSLQLSSRARVRAALTELMRVLDRKEVDRVYERVFGAKPGEKE